MQDMLWFLYVHKNGGIVMSKKKICAIVMVVVLLFSMTAVKTEKIYAANFNFFNSISRVIEKIKKSVSSKNQENESTESQTTEHETVTIPEETTIENVTESEEQMTTEQVTKTETEEATTGQETESETEETTTEAETESETEEATTEAETEETTTEQETESETEEATTEQETASETEEAATEQGNSDNTLLNDRISYYEKMAEGEAEWLWSQQLSNGAFAFYNIPNGTISINPYFSEITAIALINYDNSEEAKQRIEKYFDWHLAHINTAEEDYNGLAGTIYDYHAVNKNGIVVSETSQGSYDSTDSYSALFIKALADYVKTYGDGRYLNEHESLIKDIVNVMFATMSGGYSYAKPDYKIRYLMDNSEVYAGLQAAEYIYGNVISDDEMYKKVSEAVAFYDENFNKDWWKGDHYASVLNSDKSEYTGIVFSWDNFYPCATSQMFPILYGLIESDSTYALTVYEGLSSAWNWQNMDYIDNGTTVFCWGNFAYLAGLMNDEEKLSAYMDRYTVIVENGRAYPLYSSESAMVLMGCSEIIKQLKY